MIKYKLFTEYIIKDRINGAPDANLDFIKNHPLPWYFLEEIANACKVTMGFYNEGHIHLFFYDKAGNFINKKWFYNDNGIYKEIECNTEEEFIKYLKYKSLW